jgi:Domain of unknown function (DUF4911)
MHPFMGRSKNTGMSGNREGLTPFIIAGQCDMRMDLIEIYLRLRREDIALLKFVVESYEGIAIVRTLDRKRATVVVLAMPDAIEHVRAVLDSLRDEIEWYEIPPPAEQDDWLMVAVKSEKL